MANASVLGMRSGDCCEEEEKEKNEEPELRAVFRRSFSSDEEKKASDREEQESDGDLDEKLKGEVVERLLLDVDVIAEIEGESAGFDAGADDVGESPEKRARNDVECGDGGEHMAFGGGFEIGDLVGE